jgi:hypothetical protein
LLALLGRQALKERKVFRARLDQQAHRASKVFKVTKALLDLLDLKAYRA